MEDIQTKLLDKNGNNDYNRARIRIGSLTMYICLHGLKSEICPPSASFLRRSILVRWPTWVYVHPPPPPHNSMNLHFSEALKCPINEIEC